MKRRLLIAMLSFSVLALGENYASAQSWQLGAPATPQVRSRSPVSPYVTLGQGGNAVDYYGIIRPQTDASKSIGQLQYGFNQLEAGGINPATGLPLNPVNALGGLQTGHAATYFSYGHYFPMTPNGTVSNQPGTGGYGANYGAGTANYGGSGAGGYGTGTQQQFRPFYSGNLNSFR